MKTLSLAFVAMLMLSVSGCDGNKTSWKQADVYLLDWNLETYIAQGPDEIRARVVSKEEATFAPLMFTRRHWADASKVVEALDLGAMRSNENEPYEDTRLVVDLFNEVGQRTTYCASRFSLCTADNKQKRPIDEAFRQRFRGLAK